VWLLRVAFCRRGFGDKHGWKIYCQRRLKTLLIWVDVVTFDIVWQGKKMALQVPVSISHKIVQSHWNNASLRYLIISGLVFTTLLEPYLQNSNAWED